MTHTNSPAACELAGDLLLAFADRGPSSHRQQVQQLATFLKSIGAIRSVEFPNRQAGSIELTAE